MEKLLSHSMAIIIDIVIQAALIILLGIVIIDVAVLFNVTPVSELSYINLIGFLVILKLVVMRGITSQEVRDGVDKQEDLKDMVTIMFVRQFVNLIKIFGAWGTSYVIYWFAI